MFFVGERVTAENHVSHMSVTQRPINDRTRENAFRHVHEKVREISEMYSDRVAHTCISFL